MERALTYAEAIREATELEMDRESGVIVLGMGVDDPLAIYGTTKGLQERFGRDRVFDTPLSEDGMTGIAIGAALAGLRPIHVHIRMDFMLLAMNQLVNIAAKARYMFGGRASVPIVVRSIVGRSWGQGPQHSQSLHAMLMHVPGLRVVAPSTPFDAKGILTSAIRDNDPVVVMEHRLLHQREGLVPKGEYTVPFGKARLLGEGDDLTIVGISHMTLECVRARTCLADVGISAELLDALSLSPLDTETIAASAEKTGRLLVVDNAWLSCGAGAEIITQVIERLQPRVGVQVQRLGFAPVPCPTTRVLEDEFYPDAQGIASLAHSMVRGPVPAWTPEVDQAAELVEFRGPF